MANELELSAYHESGHALMAHYVGARVKMITIEPQWDDGPLRHADIQIEWISDFTSAETDKKIVMVALGGPVAEMIYSGEPYHPGFIGEWAADWKMAWQASERITPNPRKRLAQLERTTVQLHQLLRKEPYWSALAAVADNLLAHETLENEEVAEVLGNWLA